MEVGGSVGEVSKCHKYVICHKNANTNIFFLIIDQLIKCFKFIFLNVSTSVGESYF